ncbi:MAG: winged helix-turn-helix transcriptional regulator [Planctomycetes bacterium]|nr:winged helix-turn-helix transcriptional regulator [Planctomycetota bacterium]
MADSPADFPADLTTEFEAAFHAVFLALHRRERAGERGPGAEAWAVLEHLAATGPLTITEAARHFRRSQSATSEIVARLRRRGLLRTFADERDRRRSLVWLTERGLAQLDKSRRVLDRVFFMHDTAAIEIYNLSLLVGILSCVPAAATTPPDAAP